MVQVIEIENRKIREDEIISDRIQENYISEFPNQEFLSMDENIFMPAYNILNIRMLETKRRPTSSKGEKVS